MGIYKKREAPPMKLEQDFHARGIKVIEEIKTDTGQLIPFIEIIEHMKEEEKKQFEELYSRVMGSSLSVMSKARSYLVPR